jgi:hypothetical protein
MSIVARIVAAATTASRKRASLEPASPVTFRALCRRFLGCGDGGEDPALVNHFFTTDWPQQAGLQPGASLSDLLQATYNKVNSEGWLLPGQIQPPTFSGGMVSVSGSIITAGIPLPPPAPTLLARLVHLTGSQGSSQTWPG